MNKLISILKNPILISGFFLLLLMAAVWFFGPALGLVRFDVRIFLVLALIVIWVILAFLLKGHTSAELPPVSVTPPSLPSLNIPTPRIDMVAPNLPAVNISASGAAFDPSTSSGAAGGSDDLVGFRGQLERAIQWMRRSPIASRPGMGDIVYRIPWYMVLGLPGSGKSSALAQSGLMFPYTDPDRTSGRRGIEPTRQCDLWIANEALFLDMAGRYCLEDRQPGAWSGLLDEIRRVRQNKPLDGILLFVDASELPAADAESLREKALRIRARIDETIQRLGMVLPVYLIFHKCDRLEGFQEYFRDLNESGRAQVWGCTLRREQYQNLQPHQEFEKEFALLSRVLLERRRKRLTTKGVEKQDRIYRFPLQWSLLRDSLSRFITPLFQPNTFRDRPVFRGFYFASSLQDGQVVDPLFAYMAKRLKSAEKRGPEGAPAEVKAYFLQNLFTNILFPDRVLSGTSAVSRRRGLWRKIALGLVFGIFLPLLMWPIISSYRESRNLIDAVEHARIAPASAVKSAAEVQILKELRLVLERNDPHFATDGGRRFYWGLYIADQVMEPARRIYASRLKRNFIGPSVEDIRRELSNLPELPPTTLELRRSNRRCYLLLKSFLMMSEANRADSDYMPGDDAEILKFWQQDASADLEEVKRQLVFYAHLLEKHSRPDLLVPLDGDGQRLVARKRNYLGDIDLLANYYNRLKQEGASQLSAMSLSLALEGKDTDLMQGAEQIPGIFTRAGWDRYAQKAIGTFSADYEKGYWVLSKTAPNLDPSLPPKEAMARKLSELYFSDYNRYWQSFLGETRLTSFENRREAAEKIGRLTRSQSSALYRFFKTVAANTFQGADAKNSGNAYLDRLTRNFQSLHQFVGTGDASAGSGIQSYLQVVAKVHQQLYAFVNAGESPDQIGALKASITEALSQTAGLLQNLDPEMNGLIQPLLEQPIKMALEKTPAVDGSAGSFPSQTLAPLVPPSPQSGVAAGGMVVGGRVIDKPQGIPLEKVVVYLLKQGNTEVTLSNYLALASTDSEGYFRFPKAIPPGVYGLYVKAKGYRLVAQDITLSSSSSQLKIGLQPE